MAKTKDVESGGYDHRTPKGKPEMREMQLSRSANGGYIAEHQYDNSSGPGYTPSKKHTFDKGADLLAHVAQHMGIPGAAEEKGEKEHGKK